MLAFMKDLLAHDLESLAENDEPFIVSGSGKPLRQFIYSKDLAKLFGEHGHRFIGMVEMKAC